ncbi:MAG: fibronectin type III domain-containing protein [Bacteroidales bacterium]|jgi:hypothetical protein|nr:fibronectin type III domain-containing protein [Bacteroidales bacterium]
MNILIKYRFILIGLFLIILVINCENRDWNNPYDPECPVSVFTPLNIASAQITNTSIEITWDAIETNIDGFYIDRKRENNNWTKVSDLIDKETFFWLDTIFQPGTKYFYRVYSVAGNNISDFIVDSITTEVNLPKVSTLSVESTTSSTITCVCKIESNGGSEITKKGVCWNTSGNPTISYNNTLTSNSEQETYEIEISNLNPGTQYYIRAYVYNSKGQSYGNELSTITKSTLPAITTSEITNITRTSFDCGGNVINDGGAVVTSRGVCWNKTGNPTINDNKTTDGSDVGEFSSEIKNLEMGTLYYIRAYATNQNGTSYGDVVINSTIEASIPTLSNLDITTFLSCSARLESGISDDGGLEILETGFCWDTLGNPTIDDNLISLGSGLYNFSTDMEGLIEHTTYYVRAYAKNNLGVQYSNIGKFHAINNLASVSYNGTLYVYPIDNGDDNDWYEALNICSNLEAYGFDDWYLPDANELGTIISVEETIGGFYIDCYWSNSQGSESSDACRICNNEFSNSMNCSIPKTDCYRVRCVRRD